MRPHPAASGSRSRERGSSTVELVLLAPVLMLIIFLLVQAALYMHARHVALAAAQQGDRVARTTDLTSPVGIGAARAETLRYLTLLGHDITSHPAVSVTRDNSTATVVVHVDAISILPWLHLPITTRSQGSLEVFTATGGAR